MNGPAPQATLDDLYRVEGKAELIGGRIVQYMADGFSPSRVAGNIVFGLYRHTHETERGQVGMSTLVYGVPRLPSGRESFSPDASYYDGPLPTNLMRFIEGPPTFAVEVRSENDYGDAADRAYEVKLADYFLAGTLVVWDVDPLAETVICYRASNPSGVVWARGDIADAEPAVPGWRIPVDEIFP